MLGQKLAQESGRVTSRRVLRSDGPPAVEISFAAEGAMLGVSHRSIGTYESVVRADGTIFGSGQGVVMGGGGEMASWKGQGVGTFTKDGGVEFRGAIFFFRRRRRHGNSSTRWRLSSSTPRKPTTRPN